MSIINTVSVIVYFHTNLFFSSYISLLDEENGEQELADPFMLNDEDDEILQDVIQLSNWYVFFNCLLYIRVGYGLRNAKSAQ